MDNLEAQTYETFEKDAVKYIQDMQPFICNTVRYSRGRDFLFCNLCGTMLKVPSTSHAECPLCKTRRSIKDIRGKEISYTISAEDIRRELGINIIDEQTVQLSKVNKKCEKCDHDEASYYTRQMRSADEGQTTFYTCTRCGHQFQEN